MKFRVLTIVIVSTLLALFAAMNWTAFNEPTALTLGFASITAPLGMILLFAMAVMGGLFLVYVVFQQAGVILETRRYAKELQAQRELADKAEASRFTELRAFLEGELRRVEAHGAAMSRELGSMIGQLERGLQGKVDESARATSAYLGEIEDKLDRVILPLRV